jgi:hypothetical protein
MFGPGFLDCFQGDVKTYSGKGLAAVKLLKSFPWCTSAGDGSRPALTAPTVWLVGQNRTRAILIQPERPK